MNSIDATASLQDADAAVALNLFFSRVAEDKRPCPEMISALAAALPAALAALQAYKAVHSTADVAASAARAAHQQVLEAQVCLYCLKNSPTWRLSYHDDGLWCF